MLYLTKCVDFSCLESVAEYPHQWETDFRALTPGGNQFRMQETVAPELAIRVGRFSGPSLHRGVVPTGMRTYSILLEKAESHYFRGIPAATYDLMAFGANLELDTASGTGGSTLCTISISLDYLEAVSETWGGEVDLDNTLVVSLRPQDLTAITQSVNSLTRLEQSSSAASMAEQRSQQEDLVHAILQQLDKTDPRRHMDCKSGFRTVRKALDTIEQRIDHPVQVSTLSKELGISTRYLQKTFKKHLSVTPKMAINQMRLSRFRKELLSQKNSGQLVSNVAFDLGYDHHSQLAQSYFNAFGELPSQTLNGQ